MKKTVCLLFVLTATAAAAIWIPEGTPVRVRLNNDLPRGTAASVGQPVEFAVIEEVRAEGKVVIAVGAQAMGTRILTAGDKDHRPGIEIAIHRVRSVDGSWIDLRYGPKANTASTLLRTDQTVSRPLDPDVLVARGATFSLFVDKPKVPEAVVAPVKQYPSIFLWFISDIDTGAIWPQQYSSWLSMVGCLLILVGIIHQRRMNRQA